MNLFAEKRNKENEEKLAKEHELQKVAIKKEDIELIVYFIEFPLYVAQWYHQHIFLIHNINVCTCKMLQIKHSLP